MRRLPHPPHSTPTSKPQNPPPAPKEFYKAKTNRHVCWRAGWLKCVACGVRDGRWVDGSAHIALPATALDSGPTPKRRAPRPARLGTEGARRPIDPLGDQTMATSTTSLANRSTSVSSEPEATSDGHVGASLCWRYARISLVTPCKASSNARKRRLSKLIALFLAASLPLSSRLHSVRQLLCCLPLAGRAPSFEQR